MCAFARIMLGARGTDNRNTAGDGLVGPSVGLGPTSSWKTLVWGAPWWRLPHHLEPSVFQSGLWGHFT